MISNCSRSVDFKTESIATVYLSYFERKNAIYVSLLFEKSYLDREYRTQLVQRLTNYVNLSCHFASLTDT